MAAGGDTRTLLGIDYGARRIGVAKSDPTGLIATALTTLVVKSAADALAQVAALIREHQPAGIVIGSPVGLSGESNRKCLEIEAFANALRTVFDGPIHLWDEGYSSVEAADINHAHGKRVGKDKKRIDRLAAVIILQRFLDEQPER